MRTPVYDSAFANQELWDESAALCYWRWKFSDLPDGGMKSEIADLLARVLLGTNPDRMSFEELQVLSMCSLAVAQADPAPDESTMDFDA